LALARSAVFDASIQVGLLLAAVPGYLLAAPMWSWSSLARTAFGGRCHSRA